MRSNPHFRYWIGFLLGAFGAIAVSGPTDEIGSEKWFEAMRTSDANASMLKALAGSNGLAAVPRDGVEICGLIAFARENPFAKNKLPSLRIVSNDDRVDNVPRTAFIYQKEGERPNFYTVLKRDPAYEFCWLNGRDEHCAVWRVPADAPKQVQLQLTVDATGNIRISVGGKGRGGAGK